MMALITSDARVCCSIAGLYGDSTVCLSEDALPECDVAKLVHYVEGVKRNCAVRDPITWTIPPKDGPNHLRLW